MEEKYKQVRIPAYNYRETTIQYPYSSDECCGTCLELHDEGMLTCCVKQDWIDVDCKMVCDFWHGLELRINS